MTTENTNTNGKNKPTHTVYQVKDRGDDAIWTPLGAAWAHKDDKGFNIKLDLLPVNFDGQLTIRERKDNNEAEGQ